MRLLRRSAQAAAAFVAMEGVAYVAHRWVMHGPGIGWHESHHRARTGVVERNDLYPVTFAGLTIGAMAVGASVPRLRGPILAAGAGISAYGTAYLVVHDGLIHRRLGDRIAGLRGRGYGRWVADAHASHHARTGEPYGMLLPLTAPPRPAATAPGAPPAP